MNLPSEITSRNVQPLYNADNYVKEAKFRLQNAHQAARAVIDKMKIKNKVQYDKSANPMGVNIGDVVYVRQEPYDKLNILNKNYIITKLKILNTLTSF